MKFRKTLLLIAICVRPALAAAQDFGFDAPANASDPTLPEAMRDLAERIVPVYKEDDSESYLANLAALQLAAGDPASADATRETLHERLKSKEIKPTGRAIVFDVYTHARATEATRSVPFAKAYAQAFRDKFGHTADLEAYELTRWFVAPIAPLREALDDALDRQHDRSSIELDDALDLVRAWFAFNAYRSSANLIRPLIAEDEDRRYAVEKEVSIPVANGAIDATLVRPRHATANAPRPALLEFTLDRSGRDARDAAAHGYVSVLALARIAGDPALRPRAPFESDGDDARAAIEWIAKQPWSDGRIAMQGTGYGGFVAWSAAKRRPAALQAIVTSDPMAPGVDWPIANGIALSSAYRWVYGLLAPPDDDSASDAARWRDLDEEWYRSGRRYRELPTLPGSASAAFRSWLNHPSYDRFWQKWLPFGDEFSQVDIPVLTVTGYYSAGQAGALYYFTEHRRHDPKADHSLLVGPFDEQGVEHGAASMVRGLTLDAEARIDPDAARYEWLESALAGTKRPALLSGRVNYEVAGANEWRHEPSLDAVEQSPRRFYLATKTAGAVQALVDAKPSAPMTLTETVDLRERGDAAWRPVRDLALDGAPSRGGLLFETEPFAKPVDLAGRLRGVLSFTVNKQDVDLVIALYELRADGAYVKLFDPAYAFRASYARDRVHRQLLMAGVDQQLPFQSDRIVGRRIEAGSRLVLSLGVNKRADQQINYGAGDDVSEESIEDAGAPLRIRWHEGSFIEIPTAVAQHERAPDPDRAGR